MMIRAYDEIYLDSTQRVLGDAFDFAVNTVGLELSSFIKLMIVSGISDQIESGNPRLIAGRTGCEIVREVMTSVGLDDPDVEDAMFIDKSPEYWSGWAIAFYQWYRTESFANIFRAVNPRQLLAMYPIYHEMDIMQFVDAIDQHARDVRTCTRLKFYRDRLNLSQSELADISGVSLRMIQLYEQRQRDINKAQAVSLAQLSRALHCSITDLLEIQA